MARKAKQLDGLTKTILSTAGGLHKHGLMPKAAYEKITARHLGDAALAATQPISAKAIRALREKARMSQAAFGQHLNVTADYISKLERGAERPKGTMLVLLNVLQRHGVELVL